MPVPHTGLAMTVEQFQLFADRLRNHGVDFIIEPHLRFQVRLCIMSMVRSRAAHVVSMRYSAACVELNGHVSGMWSFLMGTMRYVVGRLAHGKASLCGISTMWWIMCLLRV